MRGTTRHWIIGGFVLLIILVGAFLGVSLLLPRGIGSPATFQVDPAEITLAPGQGWQFRAIHADQPVSDVQWTATGGVIGSEGFYTAPETPGDYTISARHPYTGYSTSVVVHVVQPVSSSLPPPTQPEIPTTTPLSPLPTLPALETEPPPTPTPSLAPSPTPLAPIDPNGDLMNFDTLEPLTGAPSGSDIRLACFDAQGRLVQEVPQDLQAEIGDWSGEGYLILWITLHEPVPDPLDVERYWLFALDTDGNPATGRPPGDGPINPDIGPEVTIGVHSSPGVGIEFAPYAFVWDAQIGDSEQRSLGLEARLSTGRDVVFIRVPAEVLASTVRALSRSEPDWNRTVGRAAALVITGPTRAVDFFPDRP